MSKAVAAYTTGEQATYTGGGDTYTGILLTLSQDVEWGPAYVGGVLNQARATVYDSQNRQVVYTTLADAYKYIPYGMISAGGHALVFDPSKFDNSGQDLTIGATYTLVIDYAFISLKTQTLSDQTLKQINALDRISLNFTYSAAAAPTLVAALPADGSTGIGTSSNIVLTFNEWIQPGSGNIVLTNTANATDTRTISVTDTTQVSVSESSLTINPTADLLAGAHYAITIASGVVKDMAGNAFAGITNATILDFTTVAPTYSVNASAISANEGSPVTFTVNTTNVAANTVINYTLSGVGITTADLGGAALSGTAMVGANGQALITLNLTSDQLTEGTETLTATVKGQSASVVVKDTSTSAASVSIRTDLAFNFDGSSENINSQLTGNFLIAGGGAGPEYLPTASGGTTGGALAVSSTGLYPATLSLSANSFQFSKLNDAVDLSFSFYYTKLSATHRAFTLGLEASPDDIWNWGTAAFYLYGVSNDATQDFGLNLVSKNSGTTTLNVGQTTLAENNWYRVETTLVNVGNSSISSRGQLINLGPNGNSNLGNLVVWDTSLANSVISQDVSVFPSISASTASGILKIDDILFSGKLSEDLTAPSLTAFSPTDNASSVPIGSNLTLTFSEPIKAGSGNLVLTNTANASDTRNITVSDAVQVAISGSTLTIDTAAYLLPGAHYALTLAPGVVKDLAGNDFAGISSPTALDFDTAPAGNSTYSPGQALIDLGPYGKLIAPVQVDGNHWYYYWDVSGDGTPANTGALNGGVDHVLRPFLNSLFIQDINGSTSPSGLSNETYRYATLNGVKVALPTYGGPVNASGVAVQAQDHSLQAGTAIGSVPASGGNSAVNSTYNDLLAVWDAYNGTGTGNTLDGTPPGWGPGNYWSATPSAAAYARFSSSDGQVMLENYGSNTSNLVALEVISPPSSGTPSGALQGIVYDWKNHSLMSGVSLAASSGNNPPEGGNAPIQFKNIVWGSDGIGKAEVWAHTATAISNFDIEVTFSGVSSKAFTHSLGANWFVFSNPVNGALSISGLANIGTGETIPAGDFKLGDLSFNSGTARQIDLHLDFGQAGSVLSTAYGLSLARDTTGTDGHFSIGSMQAGSASLAATRSISDLGNAVNSADALAALKIAVGINPNPDPDGTGPRLAPEVSPYQIMAANVTGTEGRVTSADALDILRMAVKLPSAPASEWMFVEEARDFYDEVAGKFTLDRTHANWDPKLGTTPSSTGQLNLVGVLKGDVDGSWQAPTGSTDLDVIAPNYFSTLAHTLGVPESQWGL